MKSCFIEFLVFLYIDLCISYIYTCLSFKIVFNSGKMCRNQINLYYMSGVSIVCKGMAWPSGIFNWANIFLNDPFLGHIVPKFKY